MIQKPPHFTAFAFPDRVKTKQEGIYAHSNQSTRLFYIAHHSQ